MISQPINFSDKKFTNTKNFNNDLESEFSKTNSIEQFANYSTFQYTAPDLYYYKSNKLKYIPQKKLLKKIWFSLKLKWPIIAELYLNSFIFDLIFLPLVFYFEKLNLKKPHFWNWWGRVKKFKNSFTKIVNFELYYFYWYRWFTNFFFFLIKRKSTEPKLINLFLINFYLFKNKNLFYWVISTPTHNLFFKKKKKFSWSLPQTKVQMYISNLKYLHFPITEKLVLDKTICLNFFFLLKAKFFLFKNLNNISLDKKFSYLKLYDDNIYPSTINFLKISLHFILFSELNNLFLYNFFNFLQIIYSEINVKNLFNDLYCFNFFFKFWKSHTIISKFNKRKFWIKGYERFIKSYLYNKSFKKKRFFFFINLSNYSCTFTCTKIYNLIIQLYYFVSLNIEKFKKPLLKLCYKNFILKTKFNSSYINNSFFSTKNFLVNNFWLNSTLGNNSLFNNRLKLFYFSIFLKQINIFNKERGKISFTLNSIINYSLLFNKYYRLDNFSSFKTFILFNTYSFFSVFFFFKKLYSILFFNFYKTITILSNFEIFFFKKKLLFWTNLRFFWNFEISFFNFNWIVLNFNLNLIEKFNCKIKTSYWFNIWLFAEELSHLSYEFIHSDFEWLQEFIWVKQLAEIRLVKLTNFLKHMWEINVDPGNIQYSPDFTQQHEFALTLKWGLELEYLKYTQTIIKKWFYGLITKPITENFILKKINFFYNIWKPRFKKITINEMTLQPIYKIHLLLNLSSVYELTWLNLATVVAAYRTIYKSKWHQLDNYYSYLVKWPTELKKKNVYNFISIIYNRHFLIDAYKNYYLKTGIKKKISFPKMIKKKVFNWFINPINLFFGIENNKNFFNFFIFKFFWKIGFKIKNLFKNTTFYSLLQLLIFKFYPSISLPSTLTLNDMKIFLPSIANLAVTIPIKFFIFNKKSASKLEIFDADFLLNFQINTLNIELNFLKFYINFNFNKFKSYFFFWKKISKNFSSIYYNQILSKFKNIFLNFITELFYEKFFNFFTSIFLKTQSIKKKKNVQGQLYKNISSENFSISFFSFLQKNVFSSKHFFEEKTLMYIFIEFEKLIFSDFFLNLFYKQFLNFIIINENYRHLENSLSMNYNLYNNNFTLLLILNFIIKQYLLSFNFRKQFIQIFYIWLQIYLQNQNFNLTLKKFFFKNYWLIEFSNNLELIFLNFLIEFFSFCLKK